MHDYLNEFGGAERVLLALSEMFPRAPIYTAFYKKNSEGYKRFKGKKIITSFVQKIPGFAGKLHSPLRFLAPKIWKAHEKELSKYDVVISSASWYVTKGFGSNNPGSELARGVRNHKPVEFCYCHTPPRWLYGYKTSIEWQKYWPVRVYGTIIGHFMRQYDFRQAQKVDHFIANSKEVKLRIEKFYRRKAKVIYPPVSACLNLPHQVSFSSDFVARKTAAESTNFNKRGYYLVVSRIVGGKGLELAIKAAKKQGFRLKIAGVGSGWGKQFNQLKQLAGDSTEFLGQVSDEELVKLYSEAKGFLALAENEDFGITPVEAMSCGTPVIAFRGGGYKETVVENKTGVFFEKQTVESLIKAIKVFEKKRFKREDCLNQAKKFSKDRFKREIKDFIEDKVSLQG